MRNTRGKTIMRPASLLAFGGLLALLYAQSDPAEKAARTVLDSKCTACHGPTRMSDLDVRDRATLLKGGKRGPAIVPGKANDSLLYKAVRREGELQMPPGKTPLTAAEIDSIREWIDSGAKWAGGSKAAGPVWWSFQKPVKPPVPTVADSARVRNPIDSFILAKLEEKKLKLAPEADRR